MRMRFGLIALTTIGMAAPAHAQEDRLGKLERQFNEQQARIRQLETIVAQQEEMLRQQRSAQNPAQQPEKITTAPIATAKIPVQTAVSASPASTFRNPSFDVGGDMRVRQEWNVVEGRDRSRTAVRARLRASYAVSDNFAVGSQIATGDPDDPNSTDVTLGNFVDDFVLSLDQAWIRYHSGSFTAYVGKFPQPFQRTDMLWDADVSPQGISAAYSLPVGPVKLDARGIWFIIDESSVARDSDMLGGQLALSAPVGSHVKIGLTGSYYHYRLGSVTGADAGDFRGNLISGGRYRSDFHLVEGIATLGWGSPSERWPVNITADYVRNLSAAVPGDTAFNLELSAGRTAKPGDFRIAYNFSEVEVDSVLAAFSHDNLDLSSNYRLHGLGLAFVPASRLQLDLLWYHYRSLDAAYAGAQFPSDWHDRIRLAFMVSF